MQLSIGIRTNVAPTQEPHHRNPKSYISSMKKLILYMLATALICLHQGCSTVFPTDTTYAVPKSRTIENQYFTATIEGIDTALSYSDAIRENRGINAFRLHIKNKTKNNLSVYWYDSKYIKGKSTDSHFIVVGDYGQSFSASDIILPHGDMEKVIAPQILQSISYVDSGIIYRHANMPLGQNGISLSIAYNDQKIRENIFFDIKSSKSGNSDVGKNSQISQPVSTPKSYYISRGGKRYGPFSKSKIDDMIKNNRLTSTDYIWTEGMSEWDSVGNVFE